MLNMKKMANWLSLNRLKALSPKASAMLLLSPRLVSQAGIVSAYAQSTRERTPEEISWV